MRFSIKRDGRTVCIGHCNSGGDDGEISVGRTMREIAHRIKAHGSTKLDSGITHIAAEFSELWPGDEMEITTDSQIITATWGRPATAATKRNRTMTNT